MRRPLVWLVVGPYALAAVTATWLADPVASEARSPAVDVSADPASIAAAALLRTRHRDFAVRTERSPPAGRGYFPTYLAIDDDREVGAPRRVTVVTSEPSEPEGERFRTRTVMRFSERDQSDLSLTASIPYSMVRIVDDAVQLDGPIGGVG